MSPEDVLGIVVEVGRLLEPAAQQAWRIAQQQVQAQVAAYRLWSFMSGFGFVLSIALICVGSYKTSMRRNVLRDAGLGFNIIGGILCTIFSITFMIVITNYVLMKGNPDWYAIKLLLQLAPKL